MPLDTAIERARDYWAGCDGQRNGDTRLVVRWRQGQDQADELEARLHARLSTWS
jgi:hypothetical protein